MPMAPLSAQELQHLGRHRLVRRGAPRRPLGLGLAIEDVLGAEPAAWVAHQAQAQAIDGHVLDLDAPAEREHRLEQRDVETDGVDLQERSVVLLVRGIGGDGDALDPSPERGKDTGRDLPDGDLAPEALLEVGLGLGDELVDELVEVDEDEGGDDARHPEGCGDAEDHSQNLERALHRASQADDRSDRPESARGSLAREE